jgi:hypothetical protein
MLLHSPRRHAAAAFVLLLCAAGARADLMGLSYTWNRAQFGAPANGGTRDGAAYFVLPGPLTPATPVAPVAVGVFTAFANGADSYSNVGYGLTLTIGDPNTGNSHTVAVTGQLNGTVTSDMANLSNTFTGGTGLQTFDFLGHALTVTFGFTASPAAPLNWSGAVTASVTEDVNPAPAGQPSPAAPPPQAAPEPTSLLLAGLALPALGLAARRLRRG